MVMLPFTVVGFMAALLDMTAESRSSSYARTISEDQNRLMADVFTNNERDVRPICGEVDEPVVLKVGIAIRQIIELDEPKQHLYLNIWLRLIWFDCNLQWNSSEYSNIKNVIVPYDRVWVPDITLYDNAGDELQGLTDFLVNVNSQGECHYNFPSVIKVSCRIDVTYFPFDTQRCPLKFGSWAHHGLEINTTQRDETGDISSFVPNTEWKMVEAPVKTNVIIYKCCPEPYPDVTFYVVIERKPLFYVLNLLFPCVLITAVALLGFLLPPDSGEKVSLEITVLLSLAVFLLVVSETLPPSSEHFPYIGVYFAMAMLLVSLSTLLTVVVLNIHYKGHLARPVPAWLRKLAFEYIGRILLVHYDPANVHPEPGTDRSKLEHNGITNENFKDESFIHGYVDLRQKERHILSNGSSTSPVPLSTEFFERSSTMLQEAEIQRVEDTVSPSLQPLLNVMNLQLELMRKDDARKGNKIRHDHLLSDWKKLAAVLDRFFLVTFLCVAIISSFSILLQLR